MTATQPINTQTVNAAPAGNIMEAACLLNVSFGFLGNSKKVKRSQIHEKGTDLDLGEADAPVQVDADTAMVRVSKRLLDSKELKYINRHDGQLKAWLRDICLPSFFRSGIRLVKLEAAPQVDKALEEHKVTRAELVEKFILVYAAQRDDAKERLKDLYDPKDYPSVDQVRQTFGFEWEFCAFTTPTTLKQISLSFFEKEKAKAEEHWRQAKDSLKLLLRSEFQDLVGKMFAQLAPEEDGTKKRYNSASVKNVQEFLTNFSLRDVTDDAELSKLIRDSKALLAGVDPKKLKDDDVERENLKKGFAALKDHLDTLVEEAGTREIIFED
jgi:hypothetical protein